MRRIEGRQQAEDAESGGERSEGRESEDREGMQDSMQRKGAQADAKSRRTGLVARSVSNSLSFTMINGCIQ